MPAVIANPRDRSFEIMVSKSMVRLRNPATKAFLHMSGNGTTPGTHWSWLGYLHQAKTLRKRAKARGELWPFEPVDRDFLDANPEFST